MVAPSADEADVFAAPPLVEEVDVLPQPHKLSAATQIVTPIGIRMKDLPFTSSARSRTMLYSPLSLAFSPALMNFNSSSRNFLKQLQNSNGNISLTRHDHSPF